MFLPYSSRRSVFAHEVAFIVFFFLSSDRPSSPLITLFLFSLFFSSCGLWACVFFFFSGLYLHSVFPSGTFSSLLDVTATFCRAACWCPIYNSNRKGKKNSMAQAVLFFSSHFSFCFVFKIETFFFCFSLRNPRCDPIYRLSLFFSA